MPYDTDNIVRSNKAYQVFRIILEKEEGSYGAEIARKLDVKQPLASEIIGRLYDLELLKKGKRSKAQYYELDKEGLVNNFLGLWENEVEKDSLKWKLLKDLLEDQDGIIEEQKLRALLVFYVYYYTSRKEESDIKEMLVEDFYEELNYLMKQRDLPEDELPEELKEKIPEYEIPEWLEKLHAFLEFTQLPKNPSINLEDALTEYQERKED